MSKNQEEKKKRSAVPTLLCCLIALIVSIVIAVFLVKTAGDGGSKKPASATPTPSAAAEATPTPTPEPTAEPTPDPTEQAYAVASANTTKDAPQVTDPNTWNEQGAAIMQNLGVDISVVDGMPYMIAINRAASTVTVYTADANGQYTVPYMAMICSASSSTNTGLYTTPAKYNWRKLDNTSSAQYTTRIYDFMLFHSIPYTGQYQNTMDYDLFNQLGSNVTGGRIHLAAVDAKWIYDNCPTGTKVVIYDDEGTPGPMGKPGTISVDASNEELRGWDPTDPNSENPWPEQFRSGTAIRSDAAWEQWNSTDYSNTVNKTALK